MTQTQKELVLWVLFVVMMAVIWSFVARDGSDGREAAAGMFLYVIPIALGIVGPLSFFSRGSMKANAANQEGCACWAWAVPRPR